MYRLEEILGGPVLHRIHRILNRSKRSQHDHGLILCQRRQQPDAVGVRQLHVGDDEIEAAFAEYRLALRPG